MDDDIRIVGTLVVEEEEARLRLWSVYRHAFERLNQRTPIHHGGFSVAQFEAIMQDRTSRSSSSTSPTSSSG